MHGQLVEPTATTTVGDRQRRRRQRVIRLLPVRRLFRRLSAVGRRDKPTATAPAQPARADRALARPHRRAPQRALSARHPPQLRATVDALPVADEPRAVGHPHRAERDDAHRQQGRQPDGSRHSRRARVRPLCIRLHQGAQLDESQRDAAQPRRHGNGPLRRHHPAAALSDADESDARQLRHRRLLGGRRRARLLRLPVGIHAVPADAAVSQLLRCRLVLVLPGGVHGVRRRAAQPRRHGRHVHAHLRESAPARSALQQRRAQVVDAEQSARARHDAPHPRLLRAVLAAELPLPDRHGHQRQGSNNDNDT